MRIAVLQFPGSNCDMDAVHAFNNALETRAELLWHKATSLEGYDAVFLPGGFSYGDYLRCGAIARFSPIMKAVAEFAAQGGPVMGVCNGFQVLCEAGLLPGALICNDCLEFRCLTQAVSVEDSLPGVFDKATLGDKLNIPIAHGEGNYRIDEAGLHALKENNQILMRYLNNVNGSIENIAGVRNERGNVWGMMPHPERAVEKIHSNTDGQGILKAFLEGVKAGV